MGKPLFETHRFGDRRTVVRRFKKGEQVLVRELGTPCVTSADRATIFNADCDVKVTEEFVNKFTHGEWTVVQVHTAPGDIVSTALGDLELGPRAPTEIPEATALRTSWWSRFWAWFWGRP